LTFDRWREIKRGAKPTPEEQRALQECRRLGRELAPVPQFSNAHRTGRELRAALTGYRARFPARSTVAQPVAKSAACSAQQHPRERRPSTSRRSARTSQSRGDPDEPAPPLGRPSVTKLGECEQCGGVLVQPATGRPRRHCSDACKQRAYRQRQPTMTAARPAALTFEQRKWLRDEISARRLENARAIERAERAVDQEARRLGVAA
jgi:hypothetical protein